MLDHPSSARCTVDHAHEVLLHATARASERLLDDDSFTDGVVDAFRILGDATDVDRVYLFENGTDPETGVLLTSQRYEWARDEVAPQIDNPELQNVPFEAAGYGRWVRILEQGGAVAGPVATFPPEEQALLEAQDILSLLVVPITLDGALWGFVGFDDCHRVRDWSGSERAALTMAAGLIARALLRRRDQRALQVSEERYERLISSVEDVVFQTDTAGAWVFLNPAWTEHTGHTAGDSLGRDVRQFMHAEDWARTEPLFVPRLTDGGAVESTEIRCRTEDGGYRWFVVQARTRYAEDGSVAGMSGTLHDVTERRRATEALAKALERERELGELKSRFITMASHELRTPLTAITSSADLLERHAGGLPAERRQRLFARIQDNVHRMTTLLEDVLLVGEADGGTLRCEPEPLDVRMFCKGVVDAAQLDAGTRRRVRFQADPAPLVTNADPGLLHLAVANLLKNACRYSPETSTVEVEVRHQGEAVTIAVRDEGVGVPQADLARIFQPFHRGSNVAAKEGTGLGLTIVERVAHLHGGRVDVESTPGERTIFTLTLPEHATGGALGIERAA